ncbi:unnamed protein product [Sphagnum troendelagicum]
MERETCDELMPLGRKREKRRRAAGDTGWKRRKEVSSNNARAGRGARSETKNRNGEYLPGTLLPLVPDARLTFNGADT